MSISASVVEINIIVIYELVIDLKVLIRNDYYLNKKLVIRKIMLWDVKKKIKEA